MLKVKSIFASQSKDKGIGTSSSEFASTSTSPSFFYCPLAKSKAKPSANKILQMSTPRKLFSSPFQSTCSTNFTKTQSTLYCLKSKNKLLNIHNGKSQRYTEVKNSENQKPTQTFESKIKNTDSEKPKWKFPFNQSEHCFQPLKMKKNSKTKKSILKLPGLQQLSLGKIYLTLHEQYEAVPFENKNLSDDTEEFNNKDSDDQQTSQKENSLNKTVKVKKEIRTVDLKFEKNLRKEIKSLTRDTDKILTLQFKDVREVR